MRGSSRVTRAAGAESPPVVEASERGAVRRAGEVMGSGGVVVFPTETVYGIGVRSGDARARRRLALLKGREARKPFQILAADLRSARALCPEMPAVAVRLARGCWPGPLTLVVRRKAGGWVGIRVPDHGVARRLIRAGGGTIVATSANLAGGKPAVTAAEAMAALGARADLVLDGGRARCGVASSVVKVGRKGWKILREGALRAAELERMAGSPPVP